MSVLIKGMKMPKSCSSCGFMYGGCGDGYYCSLLKKTFEIWNEISVKRAKGCLLVEVPPHGRLIDADALMTEVMDSDLDHLQRDDWKEVIQIVEDAPTIIEAEGSSK